MVSSAETTKNIGLLGSNKKSATLENLRIETAQQLETKVGERLAYILQSIYRKGRRVYTNVVLPLGEK